MLLRDQSMEAENESLTNNNNVLKKTKMQSNGYWVKVMVEVNSLMQEIGLSFHDLFNGNIHHGWSHNETVEVDVEEISHESSSVQPKQALLALEIQSPLALTQNPSPSPTWDLELTPSLQATWKTKLLILGLVLKLHFFYIIKNVYIVVYTNNCILCQ